MSEEKLEHESYVITLDTLLYSMEPIMKYMKDPSVFEVYANPDGHVWIDTLGKGRVKTDLKLDPSNVKQIILDVAAITDQIIPMSSMPISPQTTCSQSAVSRATCLPLCRPRR